MRTRWVVLGCALAAAGAAAGPPPPVGLSAAEAVERARTKVVVLKTREAGRGGAATGFLAAPGLVLTVRHAVPPGPAVIAWLNGVGYEAELLSAHPERDLALLTLRAPELLLQPLTLARTTVDLDAGEALVILAGPAQPSPRVPPRVPSGRHPGRHPARGEPRDRVVIPAVYRARTLLRPPDGPAAPVLALDAAVERGDSGSPVLRVRDGTVVGVLTGRERPGAGRPTAYAVPVEAAHAWLEHAADGRPRPAGFYLFPGGTP